MTGHDGAALGEYLFSARSLAEYRAMFDLVRWPARVLDCPGGAASFAAEAAAQGVAAVAADPLYAAPAAPLAVRAAADAARGNDFMADPVRRARFVFAFFASPAEHLRQRQHSARLFADDFAAGARGRYVAAALPTLPFATASFDLVLSSHLLFTYGERLDPAFHVAALAELVRVSRAQVRVFPLLLHTTGARYPDLDLVRRRLSGTGVDSEIRRVGYEFQRGGDEMLLLSRR